MTARTDRAWEIATWPIAAAVWHGLNAIDEVREAAGWVLDAVHPCQWSNATDGDAGEGERRCSGCVHPSHAGPCAAPAIVDACGCPTRAGER